MKKIFLLLVGFLSACSSADLRISHGENFAARSGFSREQISTNYFKINTYSKILAPTKEANVYIEGDGFAVAGRGRLSVNPTPRNPLSLKLAAADSAKNVIYIARPCQYIETGEDAKCEKKYWSSHRFSTEVIESIDEAISEISGKYGIEKINIIGFSGGGAIATILAAKRNDIKSLRTVAGNLDHVAVNSYHRVDQMPKSLNALDYADKITKIPQHHYSGSKDRVVPVFIAEKFAEHVEDKRRCVTMTTVVEATHLGGWVEVWREAIKKPLECIS